MTELQYPCLYRRFEFISDSAAPGQWRGAPGLAMEREARYAGGPLLNQIWIQGLRHSLHGFNGGSPGAGNYAIMLPGTSAESPVTEISFENPPFKDGDGFYVESCGGGGWGSSLERDPQAVLEDVIDDYVTLEGARHDYGVVIHPERMTVDQEATDDRRKKDSEQRATSPDWMALGRKRTLTRAGVLEASSVDRRKVDQS
jgi:N-methylhydantoinase B